MEDNRITFKMHNRQAAHEMGTVVINRGEVSGGISLEQPAPQAFLTPHRTSSYNVIMKHKNKKLRHERHPQAGE